jgi:hypothetical protein
MSKQLVKADYDGIEISFSEKGWFNATQAAEKFGKTGYEWLRLPSTIEYLGALEHRYGKIPYVKTSRARVDRGGGTWMHPKLAVRFAQWLDVNFAVWCDAQIDELLRGTHRYFDWKRSRHQGTSSFKVMNEALRLVREEQGKVSQSHHYSNEARLINWAVTGEFTGLDRDQLPIEDLDLLANLEVKNAVLIFRNVNYQDRKKILKQYAIDLRHAPILPIPAASPVALPLATAPDHAEVSTGGDAQ